MLPQRREQKSLKDHGQHTLRVWKGIVVGSFGSDVFVELGPRMQGVIARRHFERAPQLGEEYEFTLHGQEEGLWALSLREEKSLDTWEHMEPASLVQARVVRLAPGGLELKIGPLHAFMPKSHTGVPRDETAQVLVGKILTVEVIEVDPERQRVVVSRKLVLQRERESVHQREIAGLKVGGTVQGRVTRIEDYGVFVCFGNGMEGLVHISNLSHERIEHPSELVKEGDSLELKVLWIKQGGKRIALGLKQMQELPWTNVERRHFVDQILEAKVVSVLDYGAFLSLGGGLEGLLHISHAGLAPDRPLRSLLRPGERVCVRIHELDVEAQRLSLSLLHRNGSPITREETENAQSFAELVRRTPMQSLDLPLGKLLTRALKASLPKPRDDAGGQQRPLSA